MNNYTVSHAYEQLEFDFSAPFYCRFVNDVRPIKIINYEAFP